MKQITLNDKAFALVTDAIRERIIYLDWLVDEIADKTSTDPEDQEMVKSYMSEKYLLMGTLETVFGEPSCMIDYPTYEEKLQYDLFDLDDFHDSADESRDLIADLLDPEDYPFLD